MKGPAREALKSSSNPTVTVQGITIHSCLPSEGGMPALSCSLCCPDCTAGAEKVWSPYDTCT